MKIIYFLAILLLSLLTACQSPLQIAGSKHKLVVDKWSELSEYADGTLQEFDIAIAGQLLLEGQSKDKFVLSNFHLTKKVGAFDINLLAPSFNDKLICKKTCFLLTEYIENSSINNTLLFKYFDNYEFELFKFYGELAMVNEDIAELKKINSELVPTYINWLEVQGNKFSTIKELSTFLKSSFTKEAYIDFINSPEKVYSLLVQPVNNESQLWAIGSDINNGISNTEPLEAQLWSKASANQENIAWDLTSQAKESFFWHPDALAKNRQGLMNLAKGKELFLGDNVCSFAENYFGVISEIRGNQVMVYVIGSIQTEVDGFFDDASKGSIFTDTDKVKLRAMKVKKSFSSEDIYPCDIKFI